MRPGPRCRGGVNRAFLRQSTQGLGPDCGMQTHAASVVDLIPGIDDGGLFPIGKMEAHQTGQLHLAVSVFLFCGSQMLIQRRAMNKYHCGGLWANSCCTHPHWGESLLPAARRRVKEELGLNVALQPRGTITYRASLDNGLTEHEKVQIFHAQIDRENLCLTPDPNEVMETAWVSRETVEVAINNFPQRFAPWFRIYIHRWPELGLTA